MDKFIDNATYYFTKTTNRELYKYVNIMEYRNDEYVITNKISDFNLREMRNNMDEADIEDFDKFVERNWGKQNYEYDRIPVGTLVESQESTPRKRGRKPQK